MPPVSFDAPLQLGWLVLALPWLWWLTRRRPHRHEVGGLRPWEASRVEAPRGRRRPPPSAWCALLALGAAALALAGPRLGGGTVHVVDASLSVRARGVVAEPGGRVMRLGDPGPDGVEPVVAEREILAAIAAARDASRVVVHTDRPAPVGLPEWLVWEAPSPPSGPNAAILAVAPSGRDRFAVHLMEEAGRDLVLAADDGSRMAVTAAPPPGALVEFTVGPTARRLWLETSAGRAPDALADHDAALPRVRVVLAADAGGDAEALVAAAWPGAEVVRADRGAAAPFLRFLGVDGSTLLALDEDPRTDLGEAAGVAVVARAARAVRLRLAPARPLEECLTPAGPVRWPDLPRPPRGAAGLDRALAAVGLLALLAALGLRHRGS